MFVMVFTCVLGVVASVSDTYFKCFICLFCILQMLYRNVLKVDRVLHMGYAWEPAGYANGVQGSVGDVWSGAGPLLMRSLASPTC